MDKNEKNQILVNLNQNLIFELYLGVLNEKLAMRKM